MALSRNDAAAIGLDPGKLTFDREAVTAGGGHVRIAEVRLPRLRIGEIQLLDVQADVIDVDDGGVALLGQSFLGRLDRVSIEGEHMVLTKL